MTPYWSAFLALDRDRRFESISLGMAGGVRLPTPVPTDDIRREGRRRGYEFDALEDFVEVLCAIDDVFVRVRSEREAADVRAAASRVKQKQR